MLTFFYSQCSSFLSSVVLFFDDLTSKFKIAGTIFWPGLNFCSLKFVFVTFVNHNSILWLCSSTRQWKLRNILVSHRANCVSITMTHSNLPYTHTAYRIPISNSLRSKTTTKNNHNNSSSSNNDNTITKGLHTWCTDVCSVVHFLLLLRLFAIYFLHCDHSNWMLFWIKSKRNNGHFCSLLLSSLVFESKMNAATDSSLKTNETNPYSNLSEFNAKKW